MKTCSRCKIERPYADFGKMSKSKDGYQYHCRQCKASLHQEHHDARIVSIRASKGRRVDRNRKFVYDYLANNPCACGESDPLVLEFDHDDETLKSSEISELVVRGYALDKIKLEIEKCTVRCANCHRRRTAEQFGWWIWEASQVALPVATVVS